MPRQSIETTFVLLGFALSPSENHVAVRMLLESLDAHMREHVPDGLRKASVAHIDGGPALVKGFGEFFGQDFQLVRSLEHVKRNIRDQGVKKLTQSSWWAPTKRWVSKSAFMRNDHVFDRYWHHCFQLLEKAGESDFLAYLQTEHFQKDAGLWTATWRAAVLDPGYGSYSLNAVDSFWKLLDQYVPEEKSLPLRQVMERYEHTGRVLQNDSKWSALCVEPSTLVTPSLVGEASTELSPRLDWKGDKQVGRMSCKTLERLLAQEAPLMLQFNTEEKTTQVFCKYGPVDFDAVEMEALSDLVRSTSSSTVDAAFQQIGALDENGFHPRRVTAVYEKFTALYEEEGGLLQSHRDYWQCGMTEHFLHVSKANFGATLPEAFSSLVPRSTPTGRLRGRPKGARRTSGAGESPARGRSRGRGSRKRPAADGTAPSGRSRGRGRSSRKRPAADEVATGVEQQLEDLFGEKAASRGVEHLLGSGFASDTTAPATPPQVAARLEVLIAEGRLPRTTAEQRRRNHRTSGTTYGVLDGLVEALEAGYIHPNLPPPQGMVWNLIAHKTFALQARGGWRLDRACSVLLDQDACGALPMRAPMAFSRSRHATTFSAMAKRECVDGTDWGFCLPVSHCHPCCLELLELELSNRVTVFAVLGRNVSWKAMSLELPAVNVLVQQAKFVVGCNTAARTVNVKHSPLHGFFVVPSLAWRSSRMTNSRRKPGVLHVLFLFLLWAVSCPHQWHASIMLQSAYLDSG